MKGRLHTRYAPVRRSLHPKMHTPRLACVKPAASVHPEPGSNSSSYIFILFMRCLIYRFFPNLTILLLLFFSVLKSLSERLSIQYVYERVFLFYLRLYLKAGAKLKILFVSCKENLKIFETFFSFHFFSIPSQSFSELPVFAGCKCKTLFPILQDFFNLFFRKSLFSF